jgi:hypothetical protein
MQKMLKLAVAVIPFALFVGCTDAAKAPAEAAMAAAGSAVDSLKGEAEKFAPDAVKSVQASYASAKELIAKQDYKGALATASDIPAKVKAALAAAAAKKDALLKSWGELAAGVPEMVNSLKARIASLSSAKKLPKGIDKAVIAKANEGVAAIESGWQGLADLVKGGNYDAAIAKGKELKAQGQAILASIAGQ